MDYIIVQALLIIATIVVVLLKVPSSWLAVIGKLPGLSPNWVTLWRIPLFYIGIYYGFDAEVIKAIICLTTALMLDSTDGRLARASDLPVCTVFADNPCLQTFWIELNYSGKTSIGEWLDPMADKLQAIPGLFVQVVMSPFQLWWVIVSIILFIASLVAETVGTVIRPPFRTTTQVKEAMKTWMRGSKATGVGKTKTAFMFTAFGLFMARSMVLYPEEWFVPEVIFFFTPLLAWLSLLSKTKLSYVLDNKELGKKIDCWVDSFTKRFEF